LRVSPRWLTEDPGITGGLGEDETRHTISGTAGLFSGSGTSQGPIPPRHNLYDRVEDDKNYVIRVEAPGVPKEDLEVNLDGQILTVWGRRSFEKEEQSEEYFWREREQGRFVRTVRLPAPVNPAKVDATYNDGVMTIRVPKAETTAKSRIAIK
jgi:HSP20 family protein